MSLLLSGLITVLWTFAARRPYVAAAVSSILAIVVSTVWWAGGDSMAERGAPVGPVIAVGLTAMLAAGGGYLGSLERQRARMAERSTIVPPPPFATKPNFWFGFVIALVMLPITIGFLGTLQVQPGRTVVDGTIASAVYAPNEFGKPFYEIDVTFETSDGVPAQGVMKKYGSASIGESITVQYLDADPTDIRSYDVANQLGLIAMFGGMALVGLLIAFFHRPIRVLREMPAGVLAGTRQWSHRTDNAQTGIGSEQHFFVGDVSNIWVWQTGERTQQALSDWIATGGTPQSDAQAHWMFEVSAIEKVELSDDKFTVFMAPGSPQASKRFDVGEDGMTLLYIFAGALGWTIAQSNEPAAEPRFGGLFAKKSEVGSLIARPAQPGTYGDAPTQGRVSHW